jgi:hypothetical protein
MHAERAEDAFTPAPEKLPPFEAAEAAIETGPQLGIVLFRADVRWFQ